MNKIHRKIELIANILMIIVTLLLGTVLVQHFFLTSSSKISQNENPSIVADKPENNSSPIEIQGIKFSEQKRTIILALQAGCRFCTDSASFYKKLIENNKDKNIKIVAVMPSPIEDSQKYLESLGINNIEIKQSSLDKLQVKGTPTLILVNESGEIVKSWVGKLPEFLEEEVINSSLKL